MSFRADVNLFAVSGGWQLFNFHESTKDGSYVAPQVLRVLSDIHKDAHIPPTPGRQPTVLRYFFLAGAIGLVISTLLGVIMAYRISRRPILATITLLAGFVLPAIMLWVYR